MNSPLLQRVGARLLRSARWQKRAIMLVADALALPVLLWMAFALRFSSFLVPVEPLWLIAACALVPLGFLYACGFYRSIVRYQGTEAVWSVLFGMSGAVVTLAAMVYMTNAWLPRSILVIFWVLAVLYLGISRTLARRFLLNAMADNPNREPVAVFGAGSAGAQLVRALQAGRELQPVMVVDDSRSKQGTLLSGVEVGDRDRLRQLVAAGRVRSVLLAMPSLPRHRRMALVTWLETLDVRVQTVPTFADIATGKARLDEIKDVAIEDLLGRDPVPPREDLLSYCIRDKSVLVTGAGGSIGSELCRQILLIGPRRLILFEQSEVALYDIERELRDKLKLAGRHIELIPALGSVVNRGHVRRLCEAHGVDTLYHAAAYKHVPMIEDNPVAGLRNNVLGTLEAAEGAEAAGVKHFILISTDKAVRPTNVMGATKRFAELLLQGMAARGSATVFSMVRFGNVLGSSGSVVPLFRDQITRGGPVTVTHPDVIRYFMTIPEAAQLVIQAGAMARGGEVFVLDMGEPVRILDLAHAMVHLMGLTVRDEHHPDGDIEIVFSGLRPGEKLYEELLIGECASGTRHEMIMQASEEMLGMEQLRAALDAFRGALERGDGEAVKALLREHVCGYRCAPPALVGPRPAAADDTVTARPLH
ncbi:polysaccharide biosynthesis protein [Alloalcanivorax marinus]|uniref:polysaccharide biosynthesis protein n=1 Tax=Alloalcanivorax marinus TaxID=1177169 RepID=UPI0021D2B86A|nr:nucleoside-diphosphate sugar epimerase/dehydratase [Alloalcanivorax marinus]MCU5788586.1 polysaccharide biosynthesis protein [Alloalcanivorax marinus]